MSRNWCDRRGQHPGFAEIGCPYLQAGGKQSLWKLSQQGTIRQSPRCLLPKLLPGNRPTTGQERSPEMLIMTAGVTIIDARITGEMSIEERNTGEMTSDTITIIPEMKRTTIVKLMKPGRGGRPVVKSHNGRAGLKKSGWLAQGSRNHRMPASRSEVPCPSRSTRTIIFGWRLDLQSAGR